MSNITSKELTPLQKAIFTYKKLYKDKIKHKIDEFVIHYAEFRVIVEYLKEKEVETKITNYSLVHDVENRTVYLQYNNDTYKLLYLPNTNEIVLFDLNSKYLESFKTT